MTDFQELQNDYRDLLCAADAMCTMLQTLGMGVEQWPEWQMLKQLSDDYDPTPE